MIIFKSNYTPPPEKKGKQTLPPLYAEFSVIMYPRNLIVWGNQMGMLEFTSNMTYGF